MHSEILNDRQHDSLLQLSAMKAYALGRRSKWKDYIDLFFLLRDHFTIGDICTEATRIFGELFSEKMFRSQLCYFEDIDYTEAIDWLIANIFPQYWWYTKGEWAVLRDATLYTWEWKTNYNGSGKNGMLVTRKEGTGPCAGNSIFLPAAGRWFKSQWFYEGSQGFYWSSSLETALFAMGVEVLDSGFRGLTADRYAGLSVRPVTE